MDFSGTKAGVVGIGFIGMAHVEALRRLGVNVVGVVGSSPERAKVKAESTSLPPVYDSVADLAADPEIDVIHIASPNHAHAEQVRTVLDAGKHVVCEKPLALSSQDTADLVSQAESAGTVNAVCFNIRHYPLNHQAMAMVAAGDIGTPMFVTGSYHQDWLLKDTDWNWRLQPEYAGHLRAVADIGSHWLDLSRFVSGLNIDQVIADLSTLVPVRRRPQGSVESFAKVDKADELIDEEMSSDDVAGILLRYQGGARGAVTISQVSAGEKNSVRYEVAGSEASLSWHSQHPDQLIIGHRDRPNEMFYRDPMNSAPEASRNMLYPVGHVEGFPDTFRALFSQVYRAVLGGSGEGTYPTFADGHDAVLVTEAVATSHADERWTTIKRQENRT